MTSGERNDPTDEVLGQEVQRAVNALRQAEPVSPQWRERLLANVQMRHREGGASRRWTAVGLAATLCLGVGVAGVRARMRAQAGTIEHAPATVRFSLAAPSARRVSLVGDFDQWNPAAAPMRRGADGHTWVIEVALPPGRHVFAYSVDGGLRTDPDAPRAVEDDFGVPSSVIVVSRGGLD